MALPATAFIVPSRSSLLAAREETPAHEAGFPFSKEDAQQPHYRQLRGFAPPCLTADVRTPTVAIETDSKEERKDAADFDSSRRFWVRNPRPSAASSGKRAVRCGDIAGRVSEPDGRANERDGAVFPMSPPRSSPRRSSKRRLHARPLAAHL